MDCDPNLREVNRPAKSSHGRVPDVTTGKVRCFPRIVHGTAAETMHSQSKFPSAGFRRNSGSLPTGLRHGPDQGPLKLQVRSVVGR